MVEVTKNIYNVQIINLILKINYEKLLSDEFTSTTIDYLQLDYDNPSTTFDILKKIPFDIYKFGVITYKHDYYNTKRKIQYRLIYIYADIHLQTHIQI